MKKKEKRGRTISLACCFYCNLHGLYAGTDCFAADLRETNTILINEVESNDATGGNDWIEIINTGTTDVNIGGWYITDDKGSQRVDEASTFPTSGRHRAESRCGSRSGRYGKF